MSSPAAKQGPGALLSCGHGHYRKTFELDRETLAVRRGAHQADLCFLAGHAREVGQPQHFEVPVVEGTLNFYIVALA